MLEQGVRHAILELQRRGQGVRAIARALQVSRAAVRDVLRRGSARVMGRSPDESPRQRVSPAAGDGRMSAGPGPRRRMRRQISWWKEPAFTAWRPPLALLSHSREGNHGSDRTSHA